MSELPSRSSSDFALAAAVSDRVTPWARFTCSLALVVVSISAVVI